MLEFKLVVLERAKALGFELAMLVLAVLTFLTTPELAYLACKGRCNFDLLWPHGGQPD